MSDPRSSPGAEPDTGSAGWTRHLVLAAGCALLGVAVHFTAPLLPIYLVTLGLGVGLVGAAFMLAWGADAGEAVFSGGLVLAVVAMVAVLPEYVIEVHFAFRQEAELVTANLTGAIRLLLTCAVALPLLLGVLDRRRRTTSEPLRLGHQRRLELGILVVAALFTIQVALRGSLTIFDSVVLLVLYVLYVRRVQGTPDEEPAVLGVPAGLMSLPAGRRRPAIAALIVAAGAVVLLVAAPFADALLATGTSLGIDPYLLIQSVVPIATEAPELVVVGVLVAHQRPAQGLALLAASAVSQWTLGMGSLPIAYLLGGGGVAMPLAPREQLELWFTIALTIFVVAALATLRPSRPDAVLIVAVFAIQMVYPLPFVRFLAALVLTVFALDLLASRHRAVPPIMGAVFRRGRPT